MKKLSFGVVLCTCLLLVSFLVANAQGSFAEQLTTTADSYFIPLRENVHLHLNKTVFFKGESVWFTAYVFDQTRQRPSSESTNLHVGLYDTSGSEIARSLVLLEEGVGLGDFSLKEELEPGTYFIRAWTNYMKNFDELREFEQRILIGKSRNEPSLDSARPKLRIVPEGGKLIRNALNVIGYQLQNALPEKVTQIQLRDDKGVILLNNLGISSNGLGKVSFFYDSNRTYSLQLTLDNQTVISEPLPMPEDSGVVLQVARKGPDELKLLLSTNTETVEREQANVWFLAIHQNHKIAVEEVILEDTITSLTVPRSSLYDGVNSLTLFDTSLSPVSERLIYCESDTKKNYPALNIEVQPLAERDSLELVLQSRGMRDSLLYLSLSILPRESMADRAMHSLTTSFRLRPYLPPAQLNWKGMFESDEIQRSGEIDAIMLLSGPGIYEWKRLEEQLPRPVHSFETLISMEGALINADPAKEMYGWFLTQNTKNGFFLELDGNKAFRSNQVLFEGDSVNISLLNSRGKLRKPKAEIRFKNGVSPRTIQPYKEGVPNTVNPYPDSSEVNENELSTASRVIQLEEVVLEEKVNRSTVLPPMHPLLNGRIKTDRDVKSKATLQNYLVSLGYRAVNLGDQVLFQKGNPITNAPATVTVNGMPETTSSILNYPLIMVESVVTYNSKYISFIVVQTSGRRINNLKKEFVTHLVEQGFTPSRTYQSPLYNSLTGENYKKFGAIHWEPLLKLNPNERVTIQFSGNQQSELRVYVEGMGSDGTLISETHTINGY